MAHSIESIFIEKLWGKYSLSMRISDDVTFITGVNGSGKTTIIDIICSALELTPDLIEKLPFNSIKIQLDKVGRCKPLLTFKKSLSKSRMRDFTELELSIKNNPKNKTESKYTFPLFEEREMQRYVHHRSGYSHRFGDYFRAKEHISSLISLKTLPLLRSTQQDDVSYNSRRTTYRPPVDQKVLSVHDNLKDYFAILEKKVKERTTKLQQDTLLAMISVEKHVSTDITFSDSEITSLLETLDAFGIDGKKSKKNIDKYQKSLQEKDNTASHVIFTVPKIKKMIKDYDIYKKDVQSILSSREEFCSIISKLFFRKKVSVSPDNSLLFTQDEIKTPLDILCLSSGEKQLLILLGETLLQEKKKCIYITDEPELSMHVGWQSSLVHNIKLLNPAAQIIFATHSPEVLAKFSDDSILDMEELVTYDSKS